MACCSGAEASDVLRLMKRAKTYLASCCLNTEYVEAAMGVADSYLKGTVVRKPDGFLNCEET